MMTESQPVFVGDFYAHHHEWLKLVSPTDFHGRAALDFTDVSGPSRLVADPTYLANSRLNLVFTYVPEII